MLLLHQSSRSKTLQCVELNLSVDLVHHSTQNKKTWVITLIVQFQKVCNHFMTFYESWRRRKGAFTGKSKAQSNTELKSSQKTAQEAREKSGSTTDVLTQRGKDVIACAQCANTLHR